MLDESKVKDHIDSMISRLQDSIATYNQKLHDLDSLSIVSGKGDFYRDNIKDITMTIQYLDIFEEKKC